MRSLVWLRSDLRVRDNRALHAAAAQSRRGCAGVFVISPGEWLAHDWAPAKVDFVLRTLRVLREDLENRNIPLRIARAERARDIPSVLLRVAADLGCDALFFNREYEVNERRRDEAVERAFAEAGLRVRTFDDQVLIAPGTIRTGNGGWYTVFSPFRRAVGRLMREQGVPAPLGLPARQDAMVCPSSDIPDRVEGFASTVDPSLWPAGEHAANRRLRAFLADGLAQYTARRDFPGVDGTSRLSPYLTVGSISCRQCLCGALAQDLRRGRDTGLEVKCAGAAQWISELLWREFYVHVMVGFPRVSMNQPFRLATERIPWRTDPAQLEAWKSGRTGVPIVDAGMRQLLRTGWMHNRVRMIVAMYLSKNLLIHWREGERHFMRHLIDGFLASNNGGWQWSASTGTDAAPYFRIFNPVAQSRRFDPRGAYIRQHLPELRDLDDDAIHEPWTLPPLAHRTLDYPPPLVDLAQSRERAIRAFRAESEAVRPAPRPRDAAQET
jgi:deoxyribodipyrimidine photo-lyase